MNTSVFVKELKEKKLLLPPLSGYTDYPYRMILSRFHPPFMTTEMANAHAIIAKNQRTQKILKIAEGPQRNGVQLFGNDPEPMKKAAMIVEDLGFDYIDINMGCTARKVSRRGAGVSLMKNESKACDIVSAVATAVDVPVTCKLRLGLTRGDINVLSLSQKLAEAGAVALTVHGRTGEKKFGVPVDLAVIRETVRKLPVPVVANGGIRSGLDAVKMIHDTGAAAVMPGRALIGNPWLVREILSAITKTSFRSPAVGEKQRICRDHLELLVDFYGERTAVLKMRSILPHYFSKGLNLKILKRDVQRSHHINDVRRLLDCLTANGSMSEYNSSAF